MSNTRTIELWLANDDGLYHMARDMAKDAENAYDLGQALKDYFVEEAENASLSPVLDELLGYALIEVDWEKVAEPFWEEANPDEEGDGDSEEEEA